MSPLLLLLALALPTAAADLFVARDGSDANPGTEDRPFATLERARDAIRSLKRGAGLPAGGVTVWVHRGRYPLLAGFRLSAEDSGTEQAPVRYRARPGEEVRLTGGRIVTGFQPVRDERVRARIHPLARDAVRAADLRAQGITDLG